MRTPYIYVAMLMFLVSLDAKAQDFSDILDSISRNSLYIESQREAMNAQDYGNMRKNCLGNLDVGYNYLFGNNDIGNRQDINVTQEFDFPHVMVAKNNFGVMSQGRAISIFLSEKQKTLLTANQLCIQVVYCNAIMDHLNEDLEETKAMMESYNKLYDNGEATIVDRNKAHQAFLMFEAEYREFKALHESLLRELEYLNGGKPVEIPDTNFVIEDVSADYDGLLKEYLNKNQEFLADTIEIECNRYALKMEKNEYWPKLKIGYMSEKERVDHYQGITAGLSFNLWNRKNEIRHQKLELSASETGFEDTRLRLSTNFRNTYNDILQLQETYHSLKQHLEECDTDDMLHKMLDKGQITLLTFLQEKQFVHEMHEKILEVQRDIKLRQAELQSY